MSKSCISGSSINYWTPCTSGEGRLCDIFRELPIWNEYFWIVDLELRELSAGELSLVETKTPIYCDVPERKHEAAILLHQLLTQHRCLVSVELNEHMLNGPRKLISLIRDALRESTVLRKLKLCLPIVRPCATPVFDPRSCLRPSSTLRDPYVLFLDRDFREGLAEFLVITKTLTTLDISQVTIEGKSADDILRRLKCNTTITTLSVNTLIMSPRESRYDVVFADYLRENRTLQSLSVTVREMEDPSGHVIWALFASNTLSELNMIQFRLNTKISQLIASHLQKNQTLRSFNLVQSNLEPTWYHSDTSLHHMENFGDVSINIRPWLAVLIENKTLTELTLNFEVFNLAECQCFIRALASNASLKRVTVEQLTQSTAAEICRAVRENGVWDRFFISEPLVIEDPVVALTECKELHRIMFISGIFESDKLSEQLHATLFLLPSSTHVTSLCLCVSKVPLNMELSSLIGQYISGTEVLRELELGFCSVAGYAVDRAQRALVQALSLNKSIRKLSLKGLCFDETEVEMLADVLQYSRMIYDFYFETSESHSHTLLIQKLLPNIRSNYTLLSIHSSYIIELLNDWITVIEIMQRNFSLVERAAQFVMGTRHKFCAAATQLVHFHPRLVEKVQELASVDEKQAVLQIRNSLKSISEMDDFMCMAGVVKYRVTCYGREDSQKQLVDLNVECWLHIQQYINVGDILDEQ